MCLVSGAQAERIFAPPYGHGLGTEAKFGAVTLITELECKISGAIAANNVTFPNQHICSSRWSRPPASSAHAHAYGSQFEDPVEDNLVVLVDAELVENWVFLWLVLGPGERDEPPPCFACGCGAIRSAIAPSRIR